MSEERRRTVVAALLVASFALVLRIVHALLLGREPLSAVRLGDAAVYHEWALAIARGDWLGSEVFYQAPLYPYFLSVVYRLFGSDVAIVRWVQALVGAAACGLLVVAGSAWATRRVGVVSGLLLAVYAPAVFADALVQKSVLDGFLMTFLLWRMAVARSRSDAWSAWHIGIVLGLLALVRENALVLVPVVLVWLACSRARRPIPTIVAVVAGVLTPLLPVVVRNYAVGGEFVATTSQLGPNLYIGNHAGASGLYEPLRAGRGNARHEREDASALAERGRGRTLSSREVSAYWRSRALAFMSDQPREWLHLLGRKALLLTLAAELMDTDDLSTHAEWSALLRALALPFNFGVLLSLAGLGAVVAPRPRSLLVLHTMTLLYLASVALFFVGGRYRLPVAPILMLSAASGLVALASGVGRLPRARVVVGVVLAAALALTSFRTNDFGPRSRAVAHFNLGYEAQSRGASDSARREYQQALAWDPENVDALSNLGSLFIALSRADLALPYLERAVALSSDHVEARNHQGIALAMLGRDADAENAFNVALTLEPDHAQTRFNLARLLHQNNRLEEAIQHYRASLLARPRNVETANNLAIALAMGGDTAAAQSLLEAALAWEPDNPGTKRNLEVLSGAGLLR